VPLIFDEVTAGWRMNIGGAHLLYGVSPDIAVFAKGMSNGYPMAAIVGTVSVMESAQKSFISSTYWTDRIGPTAAIATINKMIEKDVPSHLMKIGRLVKQGWAELANKHGLVVGISGIDPLGHFEFKYENALVLKTLFTQLMLEKGFLATNAFYASYAHNENHVHIYLKAVDESFEFIAKSLLDGNAQKQLHGQICHSSFKRLA
jgi:glutamate-1-semialdehyde 2,1-aminomutase